MADATWQRTALRVPAMDCPAEEQLARAALSQVPGIGGLEFDIPSRRVVVLHKCGHEALRDALAAAGLPASVASVERSAPPSIAAAPEPANRALTAALAINLAMFAAELVAGLLAHSTALIADSIDMFADAWVYGLALLGAAGGPVPQRRAARLSGWLQLGLAGGVLLEVARRALHGGEPLSGAMIAMGLLALAANLACLLLLAPHRGGGLHVRASWIFTTNDVAANAGVIAAGMLVAVTGSALPDLVIGAAIAALVAAGAARILRMSE